MIFRGQTNEEYWEETRRLVEKWKKRDASALVRLEGQWKAESVWHSWFAWKPTELGDGVTVWLQTIERRLKWPDRPPEIMASWHLRNYIYRLPETMKK